MGGKNERKEGGREWHDRFLSPGVRTTPQRNRRVMLRAFRASLEGGKTLVVTLNEVHLVNNFTQGTELLPSLVTPKRGPIRILLLSAVAIHKSQLALVMQRVHPILLARLHAL